MIKLNKKRSKAPIIAAVMAVLATATFSASQYFDFNKQSEDMNEQELEIANTLEKINQEALGTDEEVVVDCGISWIEDKVIGSNRGWTLKIPGVESNVMHLRKEFCDDFEGKSPYVIARSLLAFNYTVYGLRESDPCNMRLADEMHQSTVKTVYGDDVKSGEDFTLILAAYVTDEDRCMQAIDSLTE